MLGNRIAEEERAGCLVLIVLWLCVFCFSSLLLRSVIVAFPGHIHLWFELVISK